MRFPAGHTLEFRSRLWFFNATETGRGFRLRVEEILFISLELWQRRFLLIRVLRHYSQIFQGNFDISARLVLKSESGGAVVPIRGSLVAHRWPIFFGSLFD